MMIMIAATYDDEMLTSFADIVDPYFIDDQTTRLIRRCR